MNIESALFSMLFNALEQFEKHNNKTKPQKHPQIKNTSFAF